TQRTQKNSTLFTDSLFGLASETTAGDAQYYTRDNTGRLISVRTPQGSHYYLTDNIGTVVALTGPGGDVSASYRYEPFGQTQDTTGQLIQPYRFAGEYLDSQTGHYKIGLRYYNPQLARWTQQDPLTGYMDPRRANPYIYAGQDPINQVDATGAAFDFGDALGAVGLGSTIVGAGCGFAALAAGPAAPVGFAVCGVVASNVGIITGTASVANGVFGDE
ncbi:MAG: RHS repeat-associated core domain-containing protein, partial [Solirubrobacteraceae bacterium MAG38_C4-C5]|nr:RHS repeat-associated core domain-containing protein [Candidatus Siliceabacter maunaloa]